MVNSLTEDSQEHLVQMPISQEIQKVVYEFLTAENKKMHQAKDSVNQSVIKLTEQISQVQVEINELHQIQQIDTMA